MNSRIWDIKDDCYVSNLAKSQVSAVFHLPVILRSVSPKFKELCEITKTSVVEFRY